MPCAYVDIVEVRDKELFLDAFFALQPVRFAACAAFLHVFHDLSILTVGPHNLVWLSVLQSYM